MSSPQADTLLGHPQLSGIAPLILAAWDDEFLTPAELLRLREAIAQEAGLETASVDSLRGWLDPAAPPSAAELRRLRRGLGEQRHAPEAPREGGWAARLATLRKVLQLPLRPGQVKEGYHADFAALSGEEVTRLRQLLDGPGAETRDRVRKLLSEDAVFRQRRTEDMHAQRELVLEQCKVLTQLPFMQSAVPQPPQTIVQFSSAFETIAQYDLSLVVKFGVQFGLFANAIEKLGTAEHHRLLPEARRCELLGCFAMTERGHGSNVRGIETRADYDPESKQFVIHTPRLAAGKEWIGGAALHARCAVVFAQLHTGGEHVGVHAFVVPIRSAAGALLPGVRAEDCGHKMGLNGVDNGRLWFDHVRIPRGALLNRFGDVEEDGSYHSSIPSEGKRFFVMLGTLVGGRVNVAGGALAASKVGLAIALRYAAQRRQFPDKSGKEKPLLDYQMHRMRLLPALAHAYGLSFAQHALTERLSQSEADPESARDTEMLANGLKAVGTWRAIHTLQQCRECCGGQGYLSSNRLDALRTDTDVFTTFEGDNTVLCQQVAKERLRLFMAQLAAISGGDGADAKTPPKSADPKAAQPAAADAKPPAAADPKTAAAPADPKAAQQPAAAAPADPKAAQQPAAAAPKGKAPAGPLTPATCKQLLIARDQHQIELLFERVQRRIEQGMDAQVAFEDCQDHTLALARAHVEHFVADRFQDAVAKEPKLGELFDLFCTSSVAEDAAWFMEVGLVTPEQARLLRKQTHDQVDKVAPRALSYVEAFAIPDNCLGPLADPGYLRDSGLAHDGETKSG
jgi:acyl-CoA oxidase